MRELRRIDSVSASALESRFSRGSHLRGTPKATWEEIDTKTKVWTIPAERMNKQTSSRSTFRSRSANPQSASARRLRFRVRRFSCWAFLSRRLTPEAAAAIAPGRDCTRTTKLVPRLGRRSHRFSARCYRNGVGTHHKRQIRSRISARRRAREAAEAYGGLGAILLRSRNERESGGAPCLAPITSTARRSFSAFSHRIFQSSSAIPHRLPGDGVDLVRLP